MMADGKSQMAKLARDWWTDMVALVIIVVLSVALAELLTGCAPTVIPKQVTAGAASWDGTNQNSGFIGYAVDGRGIITSHKRDRYNGLVAIYGSRFVPALTPDVGLSPTATNTWLIDQQHLADLAAMERWRRAAGVQLTK